MGKGIIFIVATMAVWYVAAESSFVPPLYLPSPVDVVGAYRPHIWVDLGATLFRTLIGLTLGILLAYVVHLAAIMCRVIDLLDSQFAASRAVPIIAVLPLFVMWFGFGELGRILIVMLSATLYYLAPLHNSYRLLPREWTILREQVPLSVPNYYVRVVVPGTLGTLLGTLRLTVAIAFTMAIASEYIGAQSGLGKVIDSARVTFNVPGIFLAILVALIIGFGFDLLMVTVFARLVHWAGAEGKK
jgi:NitT/TauT family transport system permease protein